jgi:carboxyl-terminal processing protease
MNKIISSMFNKRTMPFVVAATGVALAIGVGTYAKGFDKKKPLGKYENVLHRVGQALQVVHFNPKPFDDNFSKKVFVDYLQDIDIMKDVLLASDIASLKPYETKLDDEINGAPVVFFKQVGNIYKTRLAEVKNIYTTILSKPFDFTTKESIVTNETKQDYAGDANAKIEKWRKRLKYQALMVYADLLELKQKPNAPDSLKNKNNVQLEKEAREKVLKNMNILFDRLKAKDTDDEHFNLYVNTVVREMDPHTDYFPPVEKQNFEENISNTFYGIGATLRDDENGNIKIENLLAGSPAWKSQQITQGDILLKVGQGANAAEDLFGLTSSDAVRKIRGKAVGTEVRLTLKKADGSIKVVSLLRDKIKIEENFAKSTIVNNNGKKIGVIYLPEFYVNLNSDFGGSSEGNCSADVAKEVAKLKKDNVDGIIIDLRYNGGGSLGEVVKMVGLFIPQGPVVQVKELQSKPKVLNDVDKSVLYDGPLGVMINEYSASASEIFAAAIQDYNRGVIIGSQSFGKGTVQRSIELDRNDPSLGAIKLTIQKFYRINGGSTQIKGVVPDINLPSINGINLEKEENRPNALPYDEIDKSNWVTSISAFDINSLKQLSNTRIETSNSFKVIQQNIDFLKKINDKEQSLDIADYQKELKLIKTSSTQNNDLLRSATKIETTATTTDQANMSKESLEKINSWATKFVKKDIYVEEATNILIDMAIKK